MKETLHVMTRHSVAPSLQGPAASSSSSEEEEAWGRFSPQLQEGHSSTSIRTVWNRFWVLEVTQFLVLSYDILRC